MAITILNLVISVWIVWRQFICQAAISTNLPPPYIDLLAPNPTLSSQIFVFGSLSHPTTIWEKQQIYVLYLWALLIIQLSEF